MFRRNDLSPGSALLALLAAWGLNASFAYAQDRVRVTPSVTVSQSYESNVLLTDENEKSDQVTRIEPRLEFTSEGDQGHIRIFGGLTSRMYQDVDELDATDRYMGWNVDRGLSDRVTFLSEGRLAYFEATDSFDQGGETFGAGRVDQRQTRASGGLRYALSPVSSVTGTLGYRDYDYSGQNPDLVNERRDVESWIGALSYLRALNPRDQVQTSLSYVQSDFSDIGSGTETDDTLEGISSWTRAWTPNWSSSLSGGLRWLRADTDAGTDTTAGFVGGAALTRRFERGMFSLSYQRETRPSSGLGSSLDTDTVRASFETRLTQRLRLKLWGEFNQFRSASDSAFSVDPDIIGLNINNGVITPVLDCPAGSLQGGKCVGTVDDEIDSDTVTASARLDWRIRKRLFTFVSYRFRDQSSSGTRNVGEYDSHRVMLGFRFAYPVDVK